MSQSEKVMLWKKENTKSFCVQCNKVNDADIIARLEKVPNKQRYIMNLIRKDIRENERNG